MIDPQTGKLMAYPVIVVRDAESAADALRLAATLVDKHYPNYWNITGVELHCYTSEPLSREAWKASVMSLDPPEPVIHVATMPVD
jgi:hypothetical protein